MKAIVIYDSKYGNTEKIAKALTEGMRKGGLEADAVRIDAVDINKLPDYEIIAVGGPTQIHGMSGPVKEFFKKLEKMDLKGKKAFAFDTKVASWWAGSAANGIEKQLRSLHASIIRPHASAVVKKGEGPLEEGSEEKFVQIGVDIAKTP